MINTRIVRIVYCTNCEPSTGCIGGYEVSEGNGATCTVFFFRNKGCGTSIALNLIHNDLRCIFARDGRFHIAITNGDTAAYVVSKDTIFNTAVEGFGHIANREVIDKCVGVLTIQLPTTCTCTHFTTEIEVIFAAFGKSKFNVRPSTYNFGQCLEADCIFDTCCVVVIRHRCIGMPCNTPPAGYRTFRDVELEGYLAAACISLLRDLRYRGIGYVEVILHRIFARNNRFHIAVTNRDTARYVFGEDRFVNALVEVFNRIANLEIVDKCIGICTVKLPLRAVHFTTEIEVIFAAFGKGKLSSQPFARCRAQCHVADRIFSTCGMVVVCHRCIGLPCNTPPTRGRTCGDVVLEGYLAAACVCFLCDLRYRRIGYVEVILHRIFAFYDVPLSNQRYVASHRPNAAFYLRIGAFDIPTTEGVAFTGSFCNRVFCIKRYVLRFFRSRTAVCIVSNYVAVCRNNRLNRHIRANLREISIFPNDGVTRLFRYLRNILQSFAVKNFLHDVFTAFLYEGYGVNLLPFCNCGYVFCDLPSIALHIYERTVDFPTQELVASTLRFCKHIFCIEYEGVRFFSSCTAVCIVFNGVFVCRSNRFNRHIAFNLREIGGIPNDGVAFFLSGCRNIFQFVANDNFFLNIVVSFLLEDDNAFILFSPRSNQGYVFSDSPFAVHIYCIALVGPSNEVVIVLLRGRQAVFRAIGVGSTFHIYLTAVSVKGYLVGVCRPSSNQGYVFSDCPLTSSRNGGFTVHPTCEGVAFFGGFSQSIVAAEGNLCRCTCNRTAVCIISNRIGICRPSSNQGHVFSDCPVTRCSHRSFTVHPTCEGITCFRRFRQGVSRAVNELSRFICYRTAVCIVGYGVGVCRPACNQGYVACRRPSTRHIHRSFTIHPACEGVACFRGFRQGISRIKGKFCRCTFYRTAVCIVGYGVSVRRSNCVYRDIRGNVREVGHVPSNGITRFCFGGGDSIARQGFAFFHSLYNVFLTFLFEGNVVINGLFFLFTTIFTARAFRSRAFRRALTRRRGYAATRRGIVVARRATSCNTCG